MIKRRCKAKSFNISTCDAFCLHSFGAFLTSKPHTGARTHKNQCVRVYSWGSSSGCVAAHALTGKNYFFRISKILLFCPIHDIFDICKKAGIKMAVTTDAGRVHVGSFPYDLKRAYIGNDISIARFSERLNKDNYTPV